VLGEDILTVSEVIGTLSFLFFWNVFITGAASFVLFFSVKKSFLSGISERISKSFSRIERNSILIISLIGAVYCMIIYFMGMTTDPQAYKSWLKIVDFSLSISFSYIAIPSYYISIMIKNFMLRIREDLFNRYGISLPGGKSKFRFELFISFVIISVYPFTTILLSMYNDNLLSKIMFENPYLISYFIIVVIGVVFITLFKPKSFSYPLNRLTEFVKSLGEGGFNQRVPVLSDNELGTLTEAINSMAEGLEQREKLSDIFGKAVDPAVRDHLLNKGGKLGGSLTDAVILFSDIRDFTSISENMEPERIVTMLNMYFEEMSKTISSQHGLVNKYMGDAIMALFGVLDDSKDSRFRAVQAAVSMRNSLSELNRKFAESGFPLLKIGIGIHAGTVLAGNIGSVSRMEFTVIGDAVNTASRIEGLNKELSDRVLVSEEVIRDMDTSRFVVRYLTTVFVKGRKEPVRIYDITGADSDEAHILSPEELSVAVELYENSRYEESIREFQRLKVIYPSEKIVNYYLMKNEI